VFLGSRIGSDVIDVVAQLFLRSVFLDHVHVCVIIEVASEWRALPVLHDVREDGSIALAEWLPRVFHVRGGHTSVAVLVVQTTKNKSVLVEACKVESHEGTVSEGVDVPAHVALEPEGLEEPVAPVHHVEDHIFRRGVGLVRHAPAAVYEVQLACVHQLQRFCLPLGRLFVLPAREEGHFHLGETSLRVGDERPYN